MSGAGTDFERTRCNFGGESASDLQISSSCRVLIADDEPVTRRSLERHLQKAGYRVLIAADGSEALQLMEQDVFVVLLDLNMPRVNGLECLKQIRERFPDTQAIVISGAGQIQDAVTAMKTGACEYLTKPFDPDQLIAVVSKAMRHAQLSRDNRGLREAVGHSLPAADFSTRTAVSQKLMDRISTVAHLDSTVLVTGESGTGKTTIARLIHQRGPRANGPFIAVNCASLPRELIESELFGHSRGAFTGAVNDRPGKAEIADAGTLFLDEIGDLPLELQPKLLTFLQDRTLQRIGCNQVRHVDVRVIVATHQNLAQLCHEKRFRDDLYYRLSVLSLQVPALRERRGDFEDLARHILERISRLRHSEPFVITSAAIETLKAHSWPGNIRELENTLERASAFCEDQLIRPNDIEFTGLPNPERPCELVPRSSLAGLTLAEIEKQAIIDTLAAVNGNKARTARELGISEKSIYNKMRRHGLTKKRDE